MTNEQLDVIRRILELSDTVNDGLDVIEILVEENRMDPAFSMLKDVMESLEGINQSIETVQEEVGNNELAGLMNSLSDCLEQVIDAYINSDPNKIKTEMKSLVVPAYKAWHKELYRVYHGYVVA